jgi:hypothetical protein
MKPNLISIKRVYLGGRGGGLTICFAFKVT